MKKNVGNLYKLFNVSQKNWENELRISGLQWRAVESQKIVSTHFFPQLQQLMFSVFWVLKLLYNNFRAFQADAYAMSLVVLSRFFVAFWTSWKCAKSAKSTFTCFYFSKMLKEEFFFVYGTYCFERRCELKLNSREYLVSTALIIRQMN